MDERLRPGALMKQAGHNMLQGTFNHFQNKTSSLITLANDARTVKNELIKQGKDSTEIFNDIKNNGLKKFTDWFYNETSDYESSDLSQDESDFDAGFQIGGSVDDADENEKPTILDARSMRDITRGQVHAMYKIGGKQMEAATMNTAEIISTINNRSTEIIASINKSNEYLSSIDNRLKNMETWIGSTHQPTEQQRLQNQDEFVDSTGMVGLESFMTKAIPKIVSSVTDNFYVSLAKDAVGGSAKDLSSTIASLVFDNIKLAGKSVNDYLDDFNRGFSNRIDEFFTTLTDLDVVQKLGLNHTNPQENFSQYVKNQYTTDVAKFDGMTRQTIVEIIPGYLRRITEALTGQNFRVNDSGHLTTGHVKGFGDIVSDTFTTHDIDYNTMGTIKNTAQHFSKYKLSNADMDVVAATLTATTARWMYDNGRSTLSPQALDSLSEWIITESAERLSAIDNNYDKWLNACRTVMTYVMANHNDKSDFRQAAASRYKSMMTNLRDKAVNSPTTEGIGGTIKAESFYAGIIKNYNQTTGAGQIEDRYTQETDKIKSQIGDLKSTYKELWDSDNIKEAIEMMTKIRSDIAEKEMEYQKLMNKKEKELEAFNAKFDEEHISHLNTPTMSKIGKSDSFLASYDKLNSLETYSRSIWNILNRGINVRVLGKKDPKGFDKMSMSFGSQYFSHPVGTFPPDDDEIETSVDMFYRRKNMGSRESRTPSGSGTSTHRDSSDDGDVPIPGAIKYQDFINNTKSKMGFISGLTGELVNKVIDHTPLKNNKFVQDHRPTIPDPTNMNMDASDKSYFDFVRTAISAALSNGNGVEDLNDINVMINKIKNPQVRANVKRYAEKMIRMNSKKADAENEKQNDPNLPPEKKPGIIGGISQLLFGGAKRIFSPILTLLTPITSLVRTISKPLIELAKKGFKSGATDIKRGAQQIWGAIKPKSLPSFGKQKSTSSSVESIDNKTTANAGESAGVSQPNNQQQQKMAPLAPANQTYYTTQGTNASNTSTTTVAGTSWANNSQTFSWNTTKNPINNMPQVEASNKTMAVDGAATGTATSDKKESETAKNTKETSKLGNIMKGVGSITQGLIKIALTIIGSLTAVKTAVDLVIRVVKRAIQPLNNGIKRLVKAIRPVVKSLGKLVGQLAGFVTKLVDTLMGVIQPLMDMLTPLIDTVMKVLEPIMLSLDNIVDIAVKTVEPLMPLVQLVLDNVSATLMMITNLIDEIVVPFTEAIQPIIESFGETLEPMIDSLVQAVEPIRDMISTTVAKVVAPAVGKFIYQLIPAVEDVANVIKLGFGMVELHVGSIETGLGSIVAGIGSFISHISDGKFGNKMVEAGQKMHQSGETTTKAGLQNVNDAVLYALQRLGVIEKQQETKKEVEIPQNTNVQSNVTFHGSVMDGLTGNGDPHDQHSYGGFLNMSDHGCGPVALADMAARRGGGSVNAANLALGMANSGAYGINDGTSISGFMNTAASMGLGTQLGGVTAASLGMASPDNPITIIGSGYGFGTRNGNNHYMNVIGTNSTGGAYVSNPLTGRIEVHSAAGLANSALAGIYGSGDVSSSAVTDMNDQIQTLRDATSGLTTIGTSDSNGTSVDLGSVVEDAFSDLKEITSKLLGIFNFDGTFETNVQKAIGKEEDNAIIKNYKSSMTEEEYEAYVKQARALFQRENPKKALESEKKYEQRFQENLGTYLSKVAADDTGTKKVALLSRAYSAQTSNIENTYGKYDPESDAFIDEDHGSIVSLVSDVVNSKAGTGIMEMILKLVGNGVLGNIAGGIVNTVGNAISSVSDAIGNATGTSSGTSASTGSSNGLGSAVGSVVDSAYGGDNYFSNAVNDANYAGSMVSTSGVRLGGSNYTPTIRVANVRNTGSSSMTETPIHEFLARAAGQGHAWSADGNWYSKRNTPNTEGVGSTSTTHSGVDILMPDRQTNMVPLYATTDGTVVAIRSGVTGQDHTNNTAGNAVYWTDAAGYKHRFLHLANTTPLVREGQQIYGGQTLLGYMGNTGDSYGHHLHYDISTPGGQTVNPMTYFQFATGSPQSNSSYNQYKMYDDVDYYGSSDYIDPSQYLQLSGSTGDYYDGCNCNSYGGYSSYSSGSGGYSSYSSGSSGSSWSPSFANSSGKSTGTSSGGKTSGTFTSQLPGVKSANSRASNVSDKYSNSGLVSSGMDYRDQFQSKSSERKNDITTVTWHVWAGGGDMASFMPNMTSSARSMSPTYAIDSYGNIAQFVDEGRRPWTTNGELNDSRAITFEIANVPGVSDANKYAKGYDGQYPITDESMQSALDLTVDIARRNGINYFYYTGNLFRDQNLNSTEYSGYASPGNFTYHTQFVDKACPGEYIISRTDQIINKLNQRISQGRGAAIAGLDQATIEKAYAGEASTLDKDTQALIEKYTIKRGANDQWEAQSNAAHNNMITQAEKRKLKDLGIDTTTLYAPSSYTSAGTSTAGTGTKVIPQTILNMLQPSSDNESDLVYSYLVSQMGLSPEAAAGVMGNMQAESEIRANNLQNSYNSKFGLTDEQYTQMVDSGQISRSQFINDSAGYGLAQFTYNGWKEILYDTAKERGTSIGDTLTQMVALDKMLDQMPGLKTALQNTTSVQSAADMFLEQYERPKYYNYSTRRNNAWGIYNEYGDWLPTSIAGESNNSAYSNMLNYYAYIMSGDTSYLKNANSVLGIANDMVRLGDYTFNAGGGKSDYSSVKELQDMFAELYDKNANGWQLQNQSFGVYFEEGNPVSYVTRDEHGSWEEVSIVPRGTYITPTTSSSSSSSKPTSTPSGSSSGKDSKSSSSDSSGGKDSKNDRHMKDANTAKEWTSHYGGYELKMPKTVGEAISTASDLVDIGTESALQKLNSLSLADAGKILLGLNPVTGLLEGSLALGGTIIAPTLLANESLKSQSDKNNAGTWVSSSKASSKTSNTSIPTGSNIVNGGVNGIYSLNTNYTTPKFITDYIYNYGSLDAPITSYEQSVARGQIGVYLNARTNEVEKNRKQVQETNQLAYEGMLKNQEIASAKTKGRAYDQAKAKYDEAIEAYNKYMETGGATGYARASEYRNAIHSAQAELLKMDKYKGYSGFETSEEKGWNSQSFADSTKLGTTFWEEYAGRMSGKAKDAIQKEKTKEKNLQKAHELNLYEEMSKDKYTHSNDYMQYTAAQDAHTGRTSLLDVETTLTPATYDERGFRINTPTYTKGSINQAYADYVNTVRRDARSAMVNKAIAAYKVAYGSIDNGTIQGLTQYFNQGGKYEDLPYAANYDWLLNNRRLYDKYNDVSTSDPLLALQANTKYAIQSRISTDATSNSKLLQETIKAIEGNTGIKLTSEQKANYAQMIRNGINPLTQVTNTGVTGTSVTMPNTQINISNYSKEQKDDLWRRFMNSYKSVTGTTPDLDTMRHYLTQLNSGINPFVEFNETINYADNKGVLNQTALLNLAKVGTSLAATKTLTSQERSMLTNMLINNSGISNGSAYTIAQMMNAQKTISQGSGLPGQNLLETAKARISNFIANNDARLDRIWNTGVSDQLYSIKYNISGQDMARGLYGNTTTTTPDYDDKGFKLNTSTTSSTIKTGTPLITLSDALKAKQREMLIARRDADLNLKKTQTYISDYETKTGRKLTDSEKESYAKIISAGGTPEDFQRYTAFVGAQQKINQMSKSTISSGNTEYGSSYTNYYTGPSKSPQALSSEYTSASYGKWNTNDNSYTYTAGNANSVTYDSSGYATYHFGSDTSASEKASTAYASTKSYQNATKSRTTKQSKLTNAAAKSGSTKSSEQASIAYQKTMEAKNKKGKGDPDITPSTITNVDIPEIDLNKLLGNDSTSTTPKITYTSSTQYSSSTNSALKQILNNTFNVRAKRVEELLESIDKKLDSYNNKKQNNIPTSSTGSPSDQFPNNGVPTQIDKLAIG